MSTRTLAAWSVWIVAVLLMWSAGRAEPLELCPDGRPREIGTCADVQ